MLLKTPPKGMRDFLPEEVALRQKVLSVIQKTYESYGFTRIETPPVENIGLLCSKQGGDNEKLIFKILKRGDKLENAGESLCDLGLRYDLTVPLARFYANNCGKLPSVFKAMQMDYVFRADRPQRGRFRQFMQCDIDVIGEPTYLAETELISATADALANLGFGGAVVKLNDRRILSALADKCSFAPEQRESVFIILDKLDKIGVTGVMEEIEALAPGKSLAFVDMLNRITGSADPFAACVAELGDCLGDDVRQNVERILQIACLNVKNARVAFDVTLVRGMGYYTGTIYEVTLDGLDVAVAGGGRYDKMIGKITGSDVPACGFSIGFERIVLLLQEKGASAADKKDGIAVIVPRNSDVKELADVMDSCRHMRLNGARVNVLAKIKNFPYQLKQLTDMGFGTIYEYRGGVLVKIEK